MSDVDVVRRLVEDEQIPIADEQGRQGHAAALTAGEAGDRCFPVEVGDEAGDDVASTRVGGPFVIGGIPDDRVADTRVIVEVIALAEHAQAQPAAVGDATGVGFDGAGEHAEQARLAVAVAADDADHVAGLDAEGHGVEDDAGGVFEVQGFGPEEMCHNALKPSSLERAHRPPSGMPSLSQRRPGQCPHFGRTSPRRDGLLRFRIGVRE
jgi:hypothetical protein